MPRALALALVVVLAFPAAAQSPTASGADDPAFVTAREVWLSGEDDMAALGQLAGLAQAGNVSAQVLLGTIVAEGLLPDAVSTLSRADRIALTRAPGGLSGTSWLRVAAEADPVADAIEMAMGSGQQATPAAMAAALETLLAAGETGASQRLMSTFYNIGGLGPSGGWTLTARLAGHPTMQGHGLALLQGLRGILTDPTSGVSDVETLAAVEAALAIETAPRALDVPIAAVCTAACPATAEGCTDAIVQAVGGRVGFLTLSPVEMLIDSETYQASARFRGDLRHRLSASVDRVAERDACAASLLR